AAVLGRTGSEESLNQSPVASAFRRKSSAGGSLPALRPAQGRPELRRGTAEAGSHTGGPDALYAAAHGASSIDRLVAIARDFSPRIERHPGGTVVLDVSGLTRLFGEATSIAEHLARAGATRVGIATSQTTALLLARTYDGVHVAGEGPAGDLCNVPLGVLHQLVDDG